MFVLHQVVCLCVQFLSIFGKHIFHLKLIQENIWEGGDEISTLICQREQSPGFGCARGIIMLFCQYICLYRYFSWWRFINFGWKRVATAESELPPINWNACNVCVGLDYPSMSLWIGIRGQCGVRIHRFSENFQIFGKHSRFAENFQIFEKIPDFLKISRIFENFQIFRRFLDFRKMFRFSEDVQIFEKNSDFWNVFRFLESFQTFGKFSDFPKTQWNLENTLKDLLKRLATFDLGDEETWPDQNGQWQWHWPWHLDNTLKEQS